MAALPERARELVDGRNFATVATIEPDGSPQSSIVWIKRDGDDLLFSTTKGRRKHANLSRDPRTNAVVSPADNPYEYLEVRGTASITDDPAGELIEELSQKYTGQPFVDQPGAQRVIVRISPTHAVLHG